LGGRSVFRASPTGADDKIYVMNEAGDVLILATDEFKILGSFNVGGLHNHASIVVVDGLVIVRAGEKLFAFKGS
jgi:outer membrane protein assembly factor BamB